MPKWGKKIKELRMGAGINQKNFSEMMDISQPSLSELENSTYPPLHRIEQVCKIINIPLWEFFLENPEEVYEVPEIYKKIAYEIERMPSHKKNKVLSHLLSAIELATTELNDH